MTQEGYIARTDKSKLKLADLKKALVQLFKPDGHNIPDTALFYFSGHGLRDTLGIQQGFLATSDADPNSEFYGLSLQWLRRLLQESPVKQQIIWLDCCHSGELLNFNEADPGDVGQARDHSFIAASREFEQAYEDLGDRYSVLTKVLLEGLDPSRCPQQWVTNISLVDFIDKNLKNATQRPIYSNFGAPINLTRTLTTTETKTKTQETAEICPYKGLQYFDRDDADYFYGREELTDTLLNKIRQDNFFQCILGALATTENRLCLILAMRVDFFGKCLENDYSGLGKKIQENLITVTAMSEGQLREAIIKPADRVNLIVEEELIEEIIRDVKGAPGILPLLQYTLTEIWKRKTDNCLKLTTYTKLGRIAGTLNKRATEVYNGFNEEEKETVKHIFMSLTQLGEGTEDTRRRVLKRDLITNKHSETIIDNAVKKLADEKLIVTSEQVAKDSQLSREAVVDVAHEALIRNWDLLGIWLDESRSKLLEQRKIENDAREWQESGNKSDYLLPGLRLKAARKFQKESRDKYPLSTLAEAFITKSISKARNNLFKLWIIYLAVTGIIGFLVYQQRQISVTTVWKIVQETQGEKWDEKQNQFVVDEKANQQYIEQLKKDKSSDPKTPPDCSKWK
ncbi:MAG: caspase family protein [Waterburya sp.]